MKPRMPTPHHMGASFDSDQLGRLAPALSRLGLTEQRSPGANRSPSVLQLSSTSAGGRLASKYAAQLVDSVRASHTSVALILVGSKAGITPRPSLSPLPPRGSSSPPRPSRG